jgi:hypothetical protein
MVGNELVFVLALVNLILFPGEKAKARANHGEV